VTPTQKFLLAPLRLLSSTRVLLCQVHMNRLGKALLPISRLAEQSLTWGCLILPKCFVRNSLAICSSGFMSSATSIANRILPARFLFAVLRLRPALTRAPRVLPSTPPLFHNVERHFLGDRLSQILAINQRTLSQVRTTTSCPQTPFRRNFFTVSLESGCISRCPLVDADL
jgi:hypothetical protein